MQDQLSGECGPGRVRHRTAGALRISRTAELADSFCAGCSTGILGRTCSCEVDPECFSPILCLSLVIGTVSGCKSDAGRPTDWQKFRDQTRRNGQEINKSRHEIFACPTTSARLCRTCSGSTATAGTSGSVGRKRSHFHCLAWLLLLRVVAWTLLLFVCCLLLHVAALAGCCCCCCMLPGGCVCLAVDPLPALDLLHSHFAVIFPALLFSFGFLRGGLV